MGSALAAPQLSTRNPEAEGMQTMPEHTHDPGDEHIPGVTHDPVLHPVGTILVIFGAIWAMFAHIAAAAGTYDAPEAAVALILAGLLLRAIGKKARQI